MMQTVGAFEKFLRAEDGATAVEYGLLAALIGVAIVGSVTLIGEGLANVFDSTANKLKRP